VVDGGVRLLAWDSEHFGIAVARLEPADPAHVAAAVPWAREQRIDLLIARCDADAVDTIHALERTGFLLMASSAHYRFLLEKRPLPADPGGAAVRPFEPGDLPAIRDVAASAFRGFLGHFHNDPLLHRGKCDDLYLRWSTNSCSDPDLADAVLVAEVDGRVRGFITLKRHGEDRAEAVLVAVEAGAQRRGLSRSMLVASLRWCEVRGLRQHEIASQLGNFAAQRAWERVGFEIDAAWHTFHLWLDTEVRSS
jgi:GNAT superfamily N-acetyltransferase